MATKNPRINITFEQATVWLLSHLADKEHKSVSKLVKELVLEALDRREDMVLSTFAEEREKEGGRRIKHGDAWK